MDISELRKQVMAAPVKTGAGWEMLVGVFLASALICSLATAFIADPEWTALGAILFLALGLLCDRERERRDFAM